MKAVVFCLIATLAVAYGAAKTCPDQTCVEAGGMYSPADVTATKGYFCRPGSWAWYNATATKIVCRSDVKALGADCTNDMFCGPWKSCDVTKPVATPAVYTCKGVGLIGDSCAADNECKLPRTCVSGKCATSVATGGDCTSVATNTGYTPVCPVGQRCISNVCTAPVASGAACVLGGNPCAVGYFCHQTTLVCTGWFTLANGGPAQGSSNNCMSGYAKGGNCTAIPTDQAKLNMACTADDQVCGDTSKTGMEAPDFTCSCWDNALTANVAKCIPNFSSASIISNVRPVVAGLATAGCENILSGGNVDVSSSKTCVPSGYKAYFCSQSLWARGGSYSAPACGGNGFDYAAYCNGASSVGVSVIALVALIAAAFTAAF